MKMLLAYFLLLVLVGREVSALNQVTPVRTVGVLPIYYSREELLSLRPAKSTLQTDIPEVVRRQRAYLVRPRRRGKRGGIRLRLRNRGNKPPLPSMILSNVRSLRNKIEELRTLSRICYEYRESCLMAFTETWLHPDVPNSLVELEGFSLVQADRDVTSGKTRGGGVCVYIRDEWCSQYTVRESLCNPDVELLCLSLRPFYLPREFGNILCSICSTERECC